MLAFQHGELLAEGKVFQQQAAASAKDAIQGSKPESKKLKHGAKVTADCRVLGLAMLLVSKADGIVPTHSRSWRPLSYLPDDLRYDAAIVRGSFGIRIPLDLRLFTPPIPKLAFHFR
jgi:hypothetical protein